MSTRCEIGFLFPDGKVHVIYNHFNGYLDGVGLDLIKDWNTAEKAEMVVKGAYNNEDLQWDYDSVDDWIDFLKRTDREYAYLWKNDHWEYISVIWDGELYRTVWNTEWQDVKESLINLQKEVDEGL